MASTDWLKYRMSRDLTNHERLWLVMFPQSEIGLVVLSEIPNKIVYEKNREVLLCLKFRSSVTGFWRLWLEQLN